MSENIKNFIDEWNKSILSSSEQPFQEKAIQSFLPSTSRTLLPDRQGIPKMCKYINLVSQINKTEVTECLDFLRNIYPFTERFSLFYHKEPPHLPVDAPHLIKPFDVPLEMQPADVPLQIQPVDTHPQPMDINSSLPSIEKFLSKESLKKIMETTSSVSSNSQQSKASDTSDEESIFNPSDISNSFKPSDGAQTFISDVTSELNINIKSEPVSYGELIPPVPCPVYSSDSISNKRLIFETNEQIVKKIKIEPESPIKQNVSAEGNFCEQPDERCLVNQAASSVSSNMLNPLNLVKDTSMIDNSVPKEFPSQFSRIAARFPLFDESNKEKLTDLNNDLRLDGSLSRANLSRVFTCNVNIDIHSHSPTTNWENDAVEMKISAAEAKKKTSSKPFDLLFNKYEGLDCAPNNLIQPTVAAPSTSFSSNESGNDFVPNPDNSQASRNVQILRKSQQNPSPHPSLDLISKNLTSIPSESSVCENTLTNALNPHLSESKKSSNDTKNPKTLNPSNDSRPLQSNAFKPTSSSVLDGKNCNQKIPDASDRDQTSSSVLHQDDIGKKFIETKDLPPFILKWRVEWLVRQEKKHMCPRFFSRYPRVTDSYKSVLEYYNTYLPLHLLHIWLKIFHCWWTTKVLRSGVFEQIYDRQNLVVLICTLSLKSKEKMPKRDDFLICKFKSGRGSFTEFFGRVLIAKVLDDYPKSASLERPDLVKMELHIECESSHGMSPGAPVELQILLNLRIPLIQNDALKYISSMQPLVLNPKDPDRSHLSEIITVQPFESSSKITSNIDVIWHSVRSHSVSVMCTPSAEDSTKAVNYVLQQLISKTSFPLLVCFKDAFSFYQVADALKDRSSLILAIKEDEVSRVPPDLERFLAARQDPATDFHSHSVVLTLVSAAFLGGIKDRLENHETQITCVFHEAQNFVETESALFLRYNVQRLLMLGHLSRKTGLPPVMNRWGFDVSLFERFLNKTKNVQ